MGVSVTRSWDSLWPLSGSFLSCLIYVVRGASRSPRGAQGLLLTQVTAVSSVDAHVPPSSPAAGASLSAGSLSSGMHAACRRGLSPAQPGQLVLTVLLGT